MNPARVAVLLRALADELEGKPANVPAAAESETVATTPERWDPQRARARPVDEVSRQWARQTCRRKGIPLRSDAK